MRIQQYPHELSGGMQQRVMIAIALACNPKVLIADEPTTALDVTIQAQILSLLKELRDQLGIAVILITHNMGVVAAVCDRMLVMYGGAVVEEGKCTDCSKIHATLHQRASGSNSQHKREKRKAVYNPWSGSKDESTGTVLSVLQPLQLCTGGMP